ncbi:coiled-coil domain-containing protein 170 isoform X1 [Pelecanus crispus]|uniref:coiled-coil domain-containing protein 170 isoform X1 n=1 Tax=Pelecanus crispus TaxID=36300 RepID=UPI003F5D0DA9
MAAVAALPVSLSGRFKGSFAYFTIKDRLPQILTRVIDTLHRHKNEFFEEHGEKGVEAEKRAISFLSKLRNELQTDKPVTPLEDELPDAALWNQYLDYQRNLSNGNGEPSWFQSPWLYVECYMYRRIQAALAQNPPIDNFDVFKEGKAQNFFESQEAVIGLCTYFQELLKNIKDLDEKQLQEELFKLLQVSLWGNKCDLSFSAGEDSSQKSSPLQSLENMIPYILVNDMEKLWSLLVNTKKRNTEKSNVRVDIILDNAGFELVSDLVLADFLLSSKLAAEVHFHGKSIPWYVSDTTKHDFNWTIKKLQSANHMWMSRCGINWEGNLKKGVWVYRDHMFWTLPHDFSSMAEVAPDLYADLQKSNLLLFKGDLNYRKLTGDRKWEYTVPFHQALNKFHPAPLCSLRTLKSDTQVGLKPGQGEQIQASEPEWMESHDHVPLDIPVTREQMNHYRAAAETAQSELAALSVKYDCAQSELLELRSRMVSKEASFQELKAEAESYKENNARQMSLLLSLQTRIQEIEEEACVLTTSKNQAELTAQVAFKENRELKEELHEQNAKLNKYLNECEESMTQASKISRKYEELLAQLSGFLDADIREKEKPQEHLMLKVSEICKENLTLKDQVAALQEAINVHEMESKASRETIMRLVSEVTKEQKKAAGHYQDMEKLSKDLDSTIIGRQSLEMEIRNLQDKLTANQKALDASKQELHNLKKSSSELDGSLKSSREEARTAQSSLVAFKEQIATLLSGGSAIVKPSEKAILERIQEINCKEESKEIVVSQLETQIAKLTEALENQTRLYQEALERSRKAEKCSETFQDQLKHLEEELLSVDLMQDGLKLEKQKYLKFLEQLNEKMKLDSLAAEVGFDMNVDAILARVEQLVKLEGDAVIENKTMAYSLRRKLKTQKEKLESKELHMNLLRQKITQLEEEKQVRTALAVERDEANLAVRKLHKMIERLQKQLDLARDTNIDLKAKLSETNELKIKTLEQNRTIEELNKSQGKLERMKEKAEKQLNSVKSELLLKERKATEDKEKNKNMLEAVTSEMKVLKTTLAELARRERQLADFREVVSRMLGLNIASLALPDYEIITRLEGLIHSHQHHYFPCVCLKDVARAPEEHSERNIQLLH